jgi:hypothetical protein
MTSPWRPSIAPLPPTFPGNPSPIFPTPTFTAIWGIRPAQRRALMKNVRLRNQQLRPGSRLPPTGLVILPRSSLGLGSGGAECVSYLDFRIWSTLIRSLHTILRTAFVRLSLEKVSTPSKSRTGQIHISSKYSLYGCLRTQTSYRAHAFPLILLVTRDIHFGSFVVSRLER